jgi:hypothetical protein
MRRRDVVFVLVHERLGFLHDEAGGLQVEHFSAQAHRQDVSEFASTEEGSGPIGRRFPSGFRKGRPEFF